VGLPEQRKGAVEIPLPGPPATVDEFELMKRRSWQLSMRTNQWGAPGEVVKGV